jgi:hypothetical protein
MISEDMQSSAIQSLPNALTPKNMMTGCRTSIRHTAVLYSDMFAEKVLLSSALTGNLKMKDK